MLSEEYFMHYPIRLLWVSGSILIALIILSFVFLFPMVDQPEFMLPSHQSNRALAPETHYSLNLENTYDRLLWDPPAIEGDMLISLCPQRPGAVEHQAVAQIRLKSSQQYRRVELPSRIYLAYNDRGILNIQDIEGPFWVDLTMDKNENLIGQISVVQSEKEIQHAEFLRALEPPLLQKTDEFPVGTPLRILSEARWFGTDLVSQLEFVEVSQRIEIGTSVLNVGERDWICWKNGRWIKINHLEDGQGLMIARIRSVSPTTLEWDAWDSSHTRLSNQLLSLPNVHVKSEEWMSAVRIRSEKQLSCTIEKQSVILRVGDWVLKENNRWRVLRKAEDRRQFIDGIKMGDLFVLEKIDLKQKLVKGKLFFSNRTQMVPIETAACNIKQTSLNGHPRSSRKVKGL